MKKLLISIIGVLAMCPVFATGENVATSKAFVDAGVAQKQDTIPANDGAAQVLTNTGVAGEIGTKNIYDSNASYATQTDSLVTAGDFNTAVQNAIDNEFECIQYNANNECMLVRLVGTNTLPAGYTALKYIESTGTQWLDLGQPIGSDENITAKFTYLDNVGGEWFGASDGTDWRSPKFTFSYPTADPLQFMVYATANNNLDPYYYQARNSCVIGTPYIINWYGNPYKTATLYPDIRWGRTEHESYTPTRNAFLFTTNTVNGVNRTRRPMHIYYFRVEGKMDLVPARRDSDGVVGMYDVVTGTFLTNAGSGDFIAGPAIYLPHGN